jgi:hypothetical protein
VACSRHSSGIFVDGLRRIKRNVTQDSRCPCRDINLANPEYLFSVLLLHQPAQHVDNTNACSSYGTIVFMVYILLCGLTGTGTGRTTSNDRMINEL